MTDPAAGSFSRIWRARRARLQAYFSILGHFSSYARRQRRSLGRVLLASIGYLVGGVLEPWPLKIVFDGLLLTDGITPVVLPVFGALPADKSSVLWIAVFSIVAIAALRGACYYYEAVVSSRIGQQIATAVRLDLYRHLQFLSLSFHDRRKTGDLLMRLTSDVRILRELLVTIPLRLVREFLLIVTMLTVMALMDWQLALIALATLPMLAVLVRRYERPMRKAIREQREWEGTLANRAADALGAIKMVKSFRREELEVGRFGTQNKGSLKTGVKAARFEAKLRWGSEISVALATATIVSLGVTRVLAGALTPGDLIVFTTYLRAFARPLRRMSSLVQRSARGTVAAKRIHEMLQVESQIVERSDAVEAQPFHSDIRYEDVGFSYGSGRPVLDGFHLHVRAGERVAIMGPTGTGKSTVANLLARFYDPTAGRVLLDGQDLRALQIASLRDQVSFVFQEPFLLAASVRENIACGRPDATLEEIHEAARKAGIHEIVCDLSEGYDTVIGERGGTLSGGQRQCVAIARAVLKNAPIIVLDEPTTGLDRKATKLVMAALHKLMQGRTAIVISHHPDELLEVDRVVVLDKGRVVADGPPAQILASPGTQPLVAPGKGDRPR